jgi:hypothetical protein
MLLGQFLVLAITTGKKKVLVVCLAGCACVSFWFWGEIGSFFFVTGKFYYDRKKKKFWSVLAGNTQFFCCGGKIYYDRKKKVPVVYLAGCAVGSVFGSGDYDRKKKVLVVCLAGCAVMSVFDSGGK